MFTENILISFNYRNDMSIFQNKCYKDFFKTKYGEIFQHFKELQAL